MPVRLYPMLLSPILVEKPWGGRSLAQMGKELADGVNVGESWELVDLSHAVVPAPQASRTVVANGLHRGESLSRLIDELGSVLMGSAKLSNSGGFPLLVKYLDAREDLSIQVHPTAQYVAEHPLTHLKTESWFVVAAASGSVIYLGFRPGVSFEEVRKAVGSRSLVCLLNEIPVTQGDFFHLPAGAVHALGAGVLVAEVQTPSDTTFRMYDWTEKYGRVPRELHTNEALDVIDLGLVPEALGAMSDDGGRDLVRTDHYWVRELQGAGRQHLASEPETRILMITDGSVEIGYDRTYEFGEGDTVLLPAKIASEVILHAQANSTILEIGLT